MSEVPVMAISGSSTFRECTINAAWALREAATLVGRLSFANRAIHGAICKA